MDLALCVTLSLVETLGSCGVDNIWMLVTPQTLRLFLSLMGIQYLCIKIYQLLIFPNFLSTLRGLPGPKDGHPLLGQTINQFMAASPIELYLKWTMQWPDAPFIRFLEIGNRETLLVNSLSAFQDVLQTHCYSSVKPALVARLLFEISGQGVFAAEGDDHKKQRRLLSGSFSIPNLKKILPAFKQKAEGLAEFFESYMEGNSSATIEMQAAFSRATLDIIGTTVLGVELENLTSRTSKLNFRECYERMLKQSSLSKLITFIHVIVPIRWLLPIEANRGFIRASKEVRRMLGKIIRERVELFSFAEGKRTSDGSPDLTEHRDILTYMVNERHIGDGTWTESDILEHLLVFMAAGKSTAHHAGNHRISLIQRSGFETTATTLLWAVYVLASEQRIQSTLRSEVAELLARNPNPSYNDIESLRYLNNFLREVLRFHCPIVSIYRETVVDLVLAGVHVPKGTRLIICPPTTNRNPKIWGPTANAFDPNRWESLVGEAMSPYAFETFLNGPRTCIGKQFALLEMKVMLMEIVTKFLFYPPEGQNLGNLEFVNPSITMQPKGGLLVSIKRL